MQHQKRLAKLKIDWLLKKLDLIASKESVPIDDETSNDLKCIMSEEEKEVLAKFPEGSFQRLFWEQQKKATATPDKRDFLLAPLNDQVVFILETFIWKSIRNHQGVWLHQFTIITYFKRSFSLC